MEDGQALHISPYVVQIEKYAKSLKQLSHTFLKLEEKKKTFTSEEIEMMFQDVKDRVCQKCEKCGYRANAKLYKTITYVTCPH